MWTPEEAEEIRTIAQGVIPGLTTLALPEGLQVEKGPDGVFLYIMEVLPGLVALATEKAQ
jgi:hypothetical protein